MYTDSFPSALNIRRRISVDRSGGMTTIYTTTDDKKDGHNVCSLEDTDARKAAALIRQQFPGDGTSEEVCFEPKLMLWISGLLNIVLFVSLIWLRH